MCQTVPIDPILPESAQGQSIVRFLSLMKAKDAPCAFPEPNAPLLWKDGFIVEPSYALAYAKGQNALEDYGTAASVLGQRATWLLPEDHSQRSQALLRQVWETQRGQGQGGRFPFAFLAGYLCVLGHISLEDFRKVARSQIALGEEMVKQAIIRKVKEDKPTTELIKESVAAWVFQKTSVEGFYASKGQQC